MCYVWISLFIIIILIFLIFDCIVIENKLFYFD